VEARKAEAIASKKFTDEGVANDVLQFAASKLAPKLKRARQTVEAAKAASCIKRNRICFHSFRHTVSNRLESAQV
jgi:integrase